MKHKKEFENYLFEMFNGDEDMVVMHFNDEELYQDFIEQR